jgi:hypothetical protein
MTKQELTAMLYIQNIKEAKKKYVCLYPQNYKELAQEAKDQAEALFEVLSPKSLPQDILNIP